MKTLTEEIKDELLNAAGDPGGLAAIFEKHKGSKGTLYGALAQATVALKVKLEVVTGKVKVAEKSAVEIEDKFENTQCQLILLEQSRDKLQEELSSLETKLLDKKSLMDQAESLSGLGFGAGQLSELHQRLAKLAASQGVKPAEMTKLFFDVVSQYEDITGLADEAQRVEVANKKIKAEMATAQAEARAAEAKTKARRVSIDITEKLLALGMKESDLPIWNNILAKVGVPLEEMSKAIEQFGSLEKASKDRGKQLNVLKVEVGKVTSQMKAITEERDNTAAAIGAIREQALTQIDGTSKQTLRNLESIMVATAKYGELEHRAGKLEHQLALAQAFTSHDPKQWELVPRKAVCELLAGLIVWSRAHADDNALLTAPPKSISSRLMLYSSSVIRMEDVLLWAFNGLHFAQERQAVGDKG